MSGNRFKLLTPKEIASVLNRLGLHPHASPDSVDKPTAEGATAFFSELADFSFDLDPQQIKAHLPGLLKDLGFAHPEVYEDAVDAVAVFMLSQRLAAVNAVGDFSFKDLWEPQPKRLRMLLSALINCCRYKESKLSVIDTLKESLHELDGQRLQLAGGVDAAEQQLLAAQDNHLRELHVLREAEAEVQRSTAEVEKLRRQAALAERVAEEAEAGLAQKAAHRQQQEEETERLRRQVAELREQVAESPEGIEQEITEQMATLQEHRCNLDGLSNEKRSRVHRDQALARLADHVQSVAGLTLQVEETVKVAAAVSARRAVSVQDVSCVRRQAESLVTEEEELQEKVRQMSLEQEGAKEAHEARVQELAARRQEAFEHHQQLQAQRSEEQKHQHVLQLQRSELEVEVSSAQRDFEIEMATLRERQAVIQQKMDDYQRQVDTLCSECDGHHKTAAAAAAAAVAATPSPVKGRAAARTTPGRTPQSLAARLAACSPSPARNIAGNPLGLLSPARGL